jgi:hypothetical protein
VGRELPAIGQLDGRRAPDGDEKRICWAIDDPTGAGRRQRRRRASHLDGHSTNPGCLPGYGAILATLLQAQAPSAPSGGGRISAIAQTLRVS